jgi:hypothetical protein
VDHSGTLDVDELFALLSNTFQIVVNDNEPKEKSFLWTFAKEQVCHLYFFVSLNILLFLLHLPAPSHL